MKHEVQLIKKGDKPEWAIIPYKEYQELIKIYDYFDDEAVFTQAIERNKNIETIPHEVIVKLINGENPIRVWRQYRGKAMKEFAQEIGVTQSYLSQLEASKRQASQKVLKLLAGKLCVDIEELIE
jgi:DNA-directed RNA polymerase specialized sigma subunit